MHLEAVDVIEGDVGTVERVEHRRAHVGKDVGVLARAIELLLQAETDGAVTPPGDPAQRAGAGVGPQPVVGDQHDTGAAVGDLAAVEASQPPLDHRVVHVVIGEGVGNRPVAGLGAGVAAGVGQVQRRDRPQVDLLESVAAVVLGGDPIEHVRPHVLGVVAFVIGPRRRAQDRRRVVTGDGLLQFDPDDQSGPAGARAQLAQCRQGRDAA